MPSEDEMVDGVGTPVKGAFAVYLDMIDTHAIADVENIDGVGAPVGHAFWLAPVALVLYVMLHAGALAAVLFVAMVSWVLCANGYYWQAHRRYRLAMGLPAHSLARYWRRNGARAVVYVVFLIGSQVLLRYLF